MTPETRYARSDDVNIAYQVVGDGPLDLVLVPGWVSHVEHAWEEPSFAAFLRRLTSFSRLIFLDRRGTGLSDRVLQLPTMEQRMDDIRAVMDAAGSNRAALFGISEAGPMCSLFAATWPERTAALVLCGTMAAGTRDQDYPWAWAPEELETGLAHIEREWGTGVTPRIFAPSIAGDERAVQAWARFERRAVSPGGMRTLLRMLFDTDVRGILSSIRVPTLVLHRTGDQATPVGGGRYLAAHIPDAKYVELPGVDHFPWIGDSEGILDEVEEFLTGTRGSAVDRVLATVLFTDIVGSTERAAKLGDRGWRAVLERHHALVREQLTRFRGREVDTTGDGFLATFDGPARAIRCACAIRDALAAENIPIRAGLHTGECELVDDTVGGIAVHLGARVAASAAADEVLVSSTVKDLVAGSGLRFADRGTRQLKGIPGEWRLWAVETSP